MCNIFVLIKGNLTSTNEYPVDIRLNAGLIQNYYPFITNLNMSIHLEYSSNSLDLYYTSIEDLNLALLQLDSVTLNNAAGEELKLILG